MICYQIINLIISYYEIFSLYFHCLVLCFWDGLLSAFPGVDVAYELFTAGCDLYNAIKLAYEYNQCCLTIIS